MEPRPADPNVGEILDGKYLLEEVVGSGAMGTVYRARHLALGTTRGVKLMKPDLAKDPTFVERFEHEARVLEKLRNPHLVALHDFCRLPSGTCYIVSEYVDGETLAARLEKPEPWTSAEVEHLFSQIADGLAAAHRVGIVHRDVSPDNIMVVETASGPQAKVLDFGLAKDVLRGSPGLTGGGLLLGKIGYASPEQMGLLPANEKVDARSDVFSLAAVLYRTLCGRLPWRSDSLQSYLHDLIVRAESELHERIEADVPLPWRALFHSALSRDRSKRPASMAKFKRVLAAAASGVSATEPPEPWPRRRSFRAAAVVVLAVLGVLAGTPLIVRLRTATIAPAPGISAAPVAGPLQEGTSPGILASTPASVAPSPASAASAPASVAPSPAAREALAHEAQPVAREAGEQPRGARLHNEERMVPEPASSTDSSSSAVVAPAIPAEGRLVLSSSPEASVLLDGEVRGHTPLSLSVTAGPHRLRLASADGQSVDEAVEVRAGATIERNHRFPGFGSLSIAADPWVEVRLDGGPPEQTPVLLPRLAAGVHIVTASRDGYEQITTEVEVQPGQTRNLSLTPRRAEGSVGEGRSSEPGDGSAKP